MYTIFSKYHVVIFFFCRQIWILKRPNESQTSQSKLIKIKKLSWIKNNVDEKQNNGFTEKQLLNVSYSNLATEALGLLIIIVLGIPAIPVVYSL